MEWVETTGSSVEDALDAALDELGVDEDDVEFEVLEEAKSGLFGRLGGNPARVRARVKPISREKPGDRGRSRGGRGPRRNGGRSRDRAGAEDARVAAPEGPEGLEGADGEHGTDGGAPGARPGGAEGGSRKRRRRRRRSGSSATGAQEEREVVTTGASEVPIGEQADVADEFVRGLVRAFGLAAEVTVRIEEDAVLIDVEGTDLGLLVGAKGATLRAIEDLVRTVVQRRTEGHGARIHLDVGGYQAKRRAALERFAGELAARVLAEGRELALEPMPPADRKIVHDVVAQIDGVVTISEGEEPRRRVVLRPA